MTMASMLETIADTAPLTAACSRAHTCSAAAYMPEWRCHSRSSSAKHRRTNRAPTICVRCAAASDANCWVSRVRSASDNTWPLLLLALWLLVGVDGAPREEPAEDSIPSLRSATAVRFTSAAIALVCAPRVLSARCSKSSSAAVWSRSSLSSSTAPNAAASANCPRSLASDSIRSATCPDPSAMRAHVVHADEKQCGRWLPISLQPRGHARVSLLAHKKYRWKHTRWWRQRPTARSLPRAPVPPTAQAHRQCAGTAGTWAQAAGPSGPGTRRPSGGPLRRWRAVQ
ncbi:hypothetical protein BC828DRAFT_37622 [Blastocladiella britannica]|nr:hypothetical protein BC828DRAFT_37622 [Blastocladiella britannica]